MPVPARRPSDDVTIRLAILASLSLVPIAGLAAPEPPVIENVTSVLPREITVYWMHRDYAQDPSIPLSDRPSSFAVYTKTAGDWQLGAVKQPLEPPNAVVRGLEPATRYEVRVCALFEGKKPDDYCSSTANVTTPSSTVGQMEPSPPLFTKTGHEARTTSIRINWSGSGDRFIIVYSAPGQAPVERSAGLKGANQFTLTDLRPATAYRIVMKGCRLQWGRWCTDYGPYTISTLAPGLRALPGQRQDAVDLAWEAMPGIDFIRLEIDGREANTHDASVAGNMTGTYLMVPEANTTYRVRMCWREGTHEGCEEVQARPRSTPPAAPTGLVAMRVGGGGVTNTPGEALARRMPTAIFQTRGVRADRVALEREFRSVGRGTSTQLSTLTWGEVAGQPWRAGQHAMEIPPATGTGARGSQATGRIRACAVVGDLGSEGRVCGEAVAAP